MTINIFKKNVQKSTNQEDLLINSGVGDRPLDEPVPTYNTRVSDVKFEGQNNTFIILGRDREKEMITGYGSIGDTQVGAIDIVAGLGSPTPIKGLPTDPDFIKDAARIYISQKTNLDSYFSIRQRPSSASSTAAAGSVDITEESGARSGVGIKADHVRIIARESLKLVTGIDEKNSMGGDISTISGVDIIGSDDPASLQSMVKGENLVESLIDLNNNLENIAKILELFLENQKSFNEITISHYHISPFYGIPTQLSELLLSEGTKNVISLLKDCQTRILQMRPQFTNFYLQSLTPTGTKYILSKYNRNN